MNELDLLVENYFTDSFEASDLFWLVESVLLEQEEVEDIVQAIIDKIREHTETVDIKSATSKTTTITDAGSRRNRGEILEFLNHSGISFDGYDISYNTGVHTDGSAIFAARISKDGKLVHSVILKQGVVGREDTPNSTKFEENLANALNKGQAVEQYVGAGEKFNSLADQVVSAITNNKPLAGKTFGKLTERGQLSQIYIDNGVTSGEPKTDLISTDGKVRISVKKQGAQFISAQGNETAAVLMSILQYDSQARKKLGSIIKDYFKYEKGISQLKGLSDDERQAAINQRNFLLKRILNFGGADLKEKIVREATLGEYKFDDEASIPNYFLVWNEDGSGELYTVEKFIKMKLPQVKFGVRGRGGTRGLSLRGDT
jgi:hypothetical protein